MNHKNRFLWILFAFVSQPAIYLCLPVAIFVCGFMLSSVITDLRLDHFGAPNVMRRAGTMDPNYLSGQISKPAEFSKVIPGDTESLHLSNKFRNPEFWDYLKSLPKLRSLRIDEADAEDLGHISEFQQLETLIIDARHTPNDRSDEKEFRDIGSLPSMGRLKQLREVHLIGIMPSRFVPAFQRNGQLRLLICECENGGLDQAELNQIGALSRIRILDVSVLSDEIRSRSELKPILEMPELELLYLSGPNFNELKSSDVAVEWFHPLVLSNKTRLIISGERFRVYLWLMPFIFLSVPLVMVISHCWGISLVPGTWTLPHVGRMQIRVMLSLVCSVIAIELCCVCLAGLHWITGAAIVWFVSGVVFRGYRLDVLARRPRRGVAIFLKNIFIYGFIFLMFSGVDALDLFNYTPYMRYEWCRIFVIRFFHGGTPLLYLGMIVFGIYQTYRVFSGLYDLFRKALSLGWRAPSKSQMLMTDETFGGTGGEAEDLSWGFSILSRQKIRKIGLNSRCDSPFERWKLYQIAAGVPGSYAGYVVLLAAGTINWGALCFPNEWKVVGSEPFDQIAIFLIVVPVWFYGMRLMEFGKFGEHLASDLLMKPISRQSVNRHLIQTAAADSFLCLAALVPTVLRITRSEGISFDRLLYSAFPLLLTGLYLLGIGLLIFSTFATRSKIVRDSWEEYTKSMAWLTVHVLSAPYCCVHLLTNPVRELGGIDLFFFIGFISVLAVDLLAITWAEFE